MGSPKGSKEAVQTRERPENQLSRAGNDGIGGINIQETGRKGSRKWKSSSDEAKGMAML